MEKERERTEVLEEMRRKVLSLDAEAARLHSRLPRSRNNEHDQNKLAAVQKALGEVQKEVEKLVEANEEELEVLVLRKNMSGHVKNNDTRWLFFNKSTKRWDEKRMPLVRTWERAARDVSGPSRTARNKVANWQRKLMIATQ